MLKPPPGALLDWAHPMSSGLVGFALPYDGHGKGVFEAVGGVRKAGASGTAMWTPGLSGVALGRNGTLTLPQFDVRAGATECSLTVLARLESGFSNWSAWATLCDGSGNTILRVLNNDGNPVPRVYGEASDSGGTLWSGGMADLVLGDPVAVTVTLDSDRKCRLYVGGRFVAGSSTGLGGTARTLASFVPGGACSQAAGSAHWEACLAHDRALSADDIAQLHLNLYLMLR